MHYYNDNDPAACAWLQAAMDDGAIPKGHIDNRSITEVMPDDLKSYTQVHLFSGIGGWPVALALAGIPTTRKLWTASCPCPTFSSAGKKKACPQCSATNPVPHVGRTGYFVCCTCGHEWDADGRHLWPEVWRLARDCGPELILGEQVASADGRVWLTSVRASLEILGYTPWGADISAAGVGAPHIRQRLYWVAHAKGGGSPLHHPWRAVDWLKCRDGKWRPVEPGAEPLADGVSNRVVKLRGYGNAIDPWQAAAFIMAVV